MCIFGGNLCGLFKLFYEIKDIEIGEGNLPSVNGMNPPTKWPRPHLKRNAIFACATAIGDLIVMLDIVFVEKS